jgi:sugar phosphate isomerase/epimerase
MRNIGIYSYFGYNLSFRERLDAIRGAGFKVTSIGLGPEEELVKSGEADLMPELARSMGLFVEYVHAPENTCNGLWSESGAARSAVREEYSSSIAYCKKHSIPTIVLHVTGSKGEQPAAANRHGLQVLQDLAKYAEDSGVRIAVENTQKPDFLDYVLSNISSPFLGFCYDSSHDFLYSAKPGALLTRWGHRLFTTHISDNDGLLDSHWLPREGKINWDIIKAGFPLATYRGVLTLEVFPKNPLDMSPLDFLKKAYRAIYWFDNMLSQEPATPQ